MMESHFIVQIKPDQDLKQIKVEMYEKYYNSL